jgi:tetratricopeptide (TPR) repeat protein
MYPRLRSLGLALAAGAAMFAVHLPALAATRVVVVPFHAPASASWQFMGESAADAITQALAQLPDVEILEWGALASHTTPPLRTDDEGAIWVRARQAGIQMVISGALRLQGDQLQLSGKFTRLPEGTVQHAASHTGHQRELFALQERFTRDFLAFNGITPTRGQSQRIHVHLDASQVPVAVAHYHQGREALRTGGVAQYEAAIRAFDQALSAAGTYTLALAAKAEALARLSFVRSHTGRSWAAMAENARQLAEVAVKQQPDLSEAQRALAMSQLVLGEPAAASIDRALALTPNDPEALTLQWMSAQAQSQQPLVKALKINPWLALAYDGLGLEQLRAGKINEALETFRKAAKANPGDALAHLYLGLALKRTWQLREATVEFQTAIRLDPLAPMAHYELGRALEAQGLVEEAFEAYRAALNADPLMAEARAAMLILRRRQEHGNRRPDPFGNRT